jgi:hypothetical protein
MSLIQWAEGKTKALGIWDIGILKIYCVLFGIIVGAYISGFVRQHVWWFVVPVAVLGLGLGFRWFTADTS